jgi:hypothetical protein
MHCPSNSLRDLTVRVHSPNESIRLYKIYSIKCVTISVALNRKIIVLICTRNDLLIVVRRLPLIFDRNPSVSNRKRIPSFNHPIIE